MTSSAGNRCENRQGLGRVQMKLLHISPTSRNHVTELLLMEKKSCTTWDAKNPENNGINYQPQLVNPGFLNHQYYPWSLGVFLYVFFVLRFRTHWTAATTSQLQLDPAYMPILHVENLPFRSIISTEYVTSLGMR